MAQICVHEIVRWRFHLCRHNGRGGEISNNANLLSSRGHKNIVPLSPPPPKKRVVADINSESFPPPSLPLFLSLLLSHCRNDHNNQTALCTTHTKKFFFTNLRREQKIGVEDWLPHKRRLDKVSTDSVHRVVTNKFASPESTSQQSRFFFSPPLLWCTSLTASEKPENS